MKAFLLSILLCSFLVSSKGKTEPCPNIDETNSRSVRCHFGTNVGDTCSFSCEDRNKVLYPPDVNRATCQKDSTWSKIPCCLDQCQKADIVFILDGSSSVGLKNWAKMKKFTEKLINLFTFKPEITRVGLVVFDKEVHKPILLDKYDKDKKGLLAAVDKLKYKGIRGANTYKALAITKDKLFRLFYGDRLFVNDHVIIITYGVGAEPDLIKRNAKRLHNDKVKVYAIGIISKTDSKKDQKAHKKQLEIMAGKSGKYYPLKGDFGKVDKQLISDLGNIICSERKCPPEE